VAARAALAAARSGGGGGQVSSGGGVSSAPRSNPLFEELKVRLVDVEAQIASLERQEKSGKAEVERLDEVARAEPEVQAQFMNLDRDYTVLRRNYEELLARRESIQIAGAARTNSDRVRLEVVDPPSMPTRPASPNRPLLLTGVLVVGLGAGALVALLLVQLDQGFHTVSDLRRLGLPVLGGVSAAAAPRRAGAALGFGFGVVALFILFGAVLAGLPGTIVRLLA
jgi:hypothetical protein